MLKIPVKDFNTDHIFDCGQCFRWAAQPDGSYVGIAMGHMAKVSFVQEEGAPAGTGVAEICENAAVDEDEAFWREYLDLDRDYSQIKEVLKAKDAVIGEAIEMGYGIRILNQEPWETLVSFIISANNNIPRIKKNIADVAKRFGTYAGNFMGEDYYNLPSPEVMAGLTEEDLAPCRLGYRAGYLIKTGAMVAADGGEVYYEKLLDYCGVGPKVANCISLFSMHHFESFPIDTWVVKVMKKLYDIEDKKEMARFAAEHFGELGGIAQQYLFYYMRGLGE